MIDGTTQAAGRVEIIDTAEHGGLLRIQGGNSTIRGLVMSGSGSGSIVLSSNNNIIEGCYFGTNADGTAAATRRNFTSLKIESSNNRIGGTTAAARNVISGATDKGIEFLSGSGNLIQGNYIGTNAAGTAAIGNRVSGIRITVPGATIGGTTAGAGNLISGNENGGGEAALNVSGVFATVQGNLFGTDASGNNRIANGGDALSVTFFNGAPGVTTIGGTTPAARNIISGSNGRGIYIAVCCSPQISSPSALIQGNYIGTNADGTVALPNLGHGILLDRQLIAVGGTAAGAGNLISGNGADGINVSGFFGSVGHVIQGNLIGTDVSGTLALPNQGDGIETSRADGTLIGGTTPEARNVISGNKENGLRLGHLDNPYTNPQRVEGNYIGVNRFGTGALGNGFEGVFITSGSGNVGGASPGASNLIAHNGGAGVASNAELIVGAVLSNSIHSNAELGIDLGDNGVTPARGESDSNPPVLTSVINTDAGTTITGTTSHYNNNASFTIQFFSNPACDPSGHGEGRTLIGQTTVPAPARYSTVNFSHTISPAVPGGAFITAVAVRTPQTGEPFNQPNFFTTSEFSNCAQLAAPTPTPTPTGTPSPSPTPTPVPLQLFVIAPARGGDAAAVTRQLTGQGFMPGATARLTRAGQPDIVGTSPNITNDGTTLTATFDLAGKARGLWSVVVTNPGGATATLADAFTVGEPRPASVWVDVIGRYTMRHGREQTFYVAYGNIGDVHAPATQIHVFLPPGLSVVTPPRLPDGGEASVTELSGGASLLQFLLSGVPANSAVYLPMRLKAAGELAHTTAEIEAHAYVSPGYEEAASSKVDAGVRITSEATNLTPNHSVIVAEAVDSEGNREEYSVDVTISDGTPPDSPQVTFTETEDSVEFTIVSAFSPSADGQGVGSQGAPALLTKRRPQPAATPIPIQVITEVGRVKKYYKNAKKSLNVLEKDSKVHQRAREVNLQKYLTDCFKRVNERRALTTIQRPDGTYRALPPFPIDAAERDKLTRMSEGAIFASKVNRVLAVAALIGKGATDEITRGVKLLEQQISRQWLDEVTNVIAQDIYNGRQPGGDQKTLDDKYQRWFQDKVEELYLQSAFGRNAFTYFMLNANGKKEADKNSNELRLLVMQLIVSVCCKDEHGNVIPIPTTAPLSGSRNSSAVNDSNPAPRNPDCGCPNCDQLKKLIDLLVVNSEDPNDKFGPQGGGDDKHYINSAPPMSYSVFFENKPEATAPAQDVVVTDQLDPTKFDLSTFQLGPVSFGKDTVVTPPPGLSQWTTDVDLRPANDLVVRVSAGLNPQTGVVRWAFTSLDPATMLPTEDPLAGFLPPNKNAPEGEGSVLFNVSTQAGVQTGDEVRNGARIVFDVNAPIDTPVWLNTIDNSLPASAVKQLAPAQPYVVFYVNWAGTDAGSGVQDYTVFFSENGGPFDAWLTETTNTSGIFAGKPGKTYSFYTVARDRAGNVEAAKTSPETATTTPNVVVNVVDDARFFVLQHYRDFLGRDPDSAGFDFWTDQIAACGADAGCVDVMRTNVSQSFFLSIEFQQTGFLVQRFYRATFGESAQRPRGLPRIAELLADAREVGAGVIVGEPGWELKLAQNREAFARAWVERPEVLLELPAELSAAQFVDKLFATSGVTPTTPERDAALVAFGAGGVAGRAAALRSVAESGSVYNRLYNPAFVQMQYIGYLRRNPDDAPDNGFSGFDFWLGKMNQFSAPGEDVRDPLTAQRRIQRAEMVRAFIVSGEYRRRFGQ
ncbi:MAG: hypothetical protein ABW208_10850 [Pyrinomonadaceae bacterium]